MRNKHRPTDLETFLRDRDTTVPISSKSLQADLSQLIKEFQALAGSSPEVNGALRSIVLQPVRQLAEDLAGIERTGRREKGLESVPYGHLGQLQRWLISPNAAGRRPSMPRRVAGWAGRDFLIWNEERGRVQFRAWGWRFYEPKPGVTEPAPEMVMETLRALPMPRRSIETARIRLILAYDQKRVERPWIRLGGRTTWSSADEREAGDGDRALPQSLVAATLPILGQRFGVRFEEDREQRLRVTWADAVLLHETVRITDWLGSIGS